MRIATLRHVLSFSLVFVIVGCGGEEAERTPAAAQTPNAGVADKGGGSSAAGNRAPRISGTPSAQVLLAYPFAFAPAATDADGDALSFSVRNLPRWASFDTATGRLSGTPAAADVGVYRDIAIAVSDGEASVELAPFSIDVVATASGAATLSWLPPTANTDGSALTDLAGYRIYWGPSPGNYVHSATLNGPGVASYVVAPLTSGTWYFVITAFNSEGVESGFSNVASKTIP